MDAKNIELTKLLDEIKRGEIQLPDFQRSWIWSDGQIKSLLESVIRGFPINSIMLLVCDADSVKFSFRKIELLESVESKPQHLILDGQQRLTSLFGALYFNEPVKITDSKGKVKKYFYYVDMAKAITSVQNSESVEDMIISVDENRKLKAKGKNFDFSTPEKEYAEGMFPLNKIFNGILDGILDWILKHQSYYENNDYKQALVNKFYDEVVKKISSYKIACIMLEKNIPLEAVCNIFENVNIGGAKLSTFDLLTAIFAKQKDENGNPIELRRDWEKIKGGFAEKGLDTLNEVDCSDFITALTLLVSYKKFCRDKKTPVSCKGEDILKLTYNEYLQYREDIIEGFVEAGKFLEEEGISTIKYLPYKSQLIPMAVIFAELKLSSKDNEASRKKIECWYWCGVFSEAYREGHLSRFAKDVVQVMKWIDKREEPEIIRKAQIVAGRLMSVNSTRSAPYKGMISLIIKNGARDFLAGRNMGTSANFAENIDVHHIFPKKYCEAQGLPKARCDNIANKTLILKKTNQTIGSDPPSIYLTKIERKTRLSSAEVDEILERHFIDPVLCRADNFDAFIDDRENKIFDEIEKLTGRQIVGR
ncbi:MAG: DUF262 domain-containing protein [Selenomonadaceae bacterium]|nr:DUF262 domain-containing protein [Selenomonadaceae bacterium]